MTDIPKEFAVLSKNDITKLYGNTCSICRNHLDDDLDIFYKVRSRIVCPDCYFDSWSDELEQYNIDTSKT